MNKELTALEALERIKNHCEKDFIMNMLYGYEKELKIIKKALKDYETQDGVLKILKEVIEFSKMLPHIEPNKDNGFDIMSAVGINIQRDIENKERELLRNWVLKECFPKELKALEIIKEKRVNTLLVMNVRDYNEYCRYMSNSFEYEALTQEEYDLLKEVL